jgi:hypothetical protein
MPGASPSAVRRYKARRNRQVVELFGSGVPVTISARPSPSRTTPGARGEMR